MPSMYLAWLSLVTVVAGEAALRGSNLTAVPSPSGNRSAASSAPIRRARNFWNTSAFAELQRRNATPVTPVTVQNPEEIQVVKQTVQVLQSSRSSEGTEKPNLSLPVLNLTLRSAAPVERSERSSVAGEAEWCKGNWCHRRRQSHGQGDRRRHARRRQPGDSRRRRSRRRWEAPRRRASYQWSPPRRRRQAAPAPAPNAPAAPWVGPIPVSPTGGCKSSRIPLDSKCKGCPPKKDGKLCASTTWYEDTTRGSCGCGGRGHVEHDYWTLTEYTAAMNCANLDTDPAKSWCPVNCGQCYKLCTTGGATQGRSPKPGVCRIFKITNRCGDGYDDHTPDWCSQHMSWQDCSKNPSKCKQRGSTNQFGYPAHFDLQDYHRQITSNTTGLDWDNAEVTFELVSCSQWTGPKQVQCTGCSR
ncbi:unnamed protein product [Durusdinium trenchii]|uniref:4-beta-glucanase n=2 Tax=Durusdinium trenchii TaxID=1381693 RepID=A0ABP0K2T2_9DINO